MLPAQLLRAKETQKCNTSLHPQLSLLPLPCTGALVIPKCQYIFRALNQTQVSLPRMIFAGIVPAVGGVFKELLSHLCLDEEGVLLLLERDLDLECLRFSSFLSEKGKAE